MKRRDLALWAVLFAVYATTLHLHASRGHRYTTGESHRLLTAASIAGDFDLDLRDQYRDKTWLKWDSRALRPTTSLTRGRLIEPQGIGFEALIAPAYAIAGPSGAELTCAALLALAFVLAAALARRLVPDPWATRGAIAVALSPPALVASTTISPAIAGAVLLAGGALLALRVREQPRTSTAFWAAALAAATPWMDAHLMLPAAVIAIAVARWLRRRQRGLAGFVALEVVLTSAVVFVTVNDRLFGGLTPYAARPDSGPSDVSFHGDRFGRLAGVLVDPDAGLLRWAPVAAMALVALWLLVRSRRGRLAVAVSEQIDTEVTGGFLALVVAAGIASAAFARPSLGGASLAAPDLIATLPVIAALAALGLRRLPRTGGALIAVTAVFGAWLLIGVRVDDGAGVAPPRGALPLMTP